MRDDGNFRQIDGIACERGFSFSKNTTYGLGGKATIAYFPKTEEEAIIVFDRLIENGEKFVVLGNGSDVLASDSGFDGAVICTKFLRGIIYSQGKLYCRSGVKVGELLKFCELNRLGGLEFLVGIPATVGGLAYMNAAANGKSISECVQYVKIYDGNLRILDNKSCQFTNKHSTMRDIICLILGAVFNVYTDSIENIKKKKEEFLLKRKFQPKGRSCGCVFQNPNGQSAGKIIDECGLKGLSIGGAYVSSDHANFIISDGKSSSDVYQLICEVKKRVFQCRGINLNEEVVYIGDFNEFNS